jgi:hypothetical protein
MDEQPIGIKDLPEEPLLLPGDIALREEWMKDWGFPRPFSRDTWEPLVVNPRICCRV